MKLTLRFVVLIVALIAAVATSSHAGLSAMAHLDAALTNIVENDVERLLAITHTRRLFRSMVVQERDYILAKGEAARAPMDKKMETLAADLQSQVDEYAKLMPPEDTQAIADIRAVRERWIAQHARVREAVRAGDLDGALSLSKQHGDDPISWEKAIGGLIELSESRLESQTKQTHQVYLTAKTRLLTVSGVAALLAAGFGYIIFMGIHRNMTEVVRLNADLEAKVKARTEALALREHSLRLVLDSTGDGIFEVGRDGRLTGVCSAAAARWFGPAEAGAELPARLYPDDPEQAAQFRLSFEQLAEDVMPWELSRDQMPKRIVRGSSIIELDYKPVNEQGQFTKILIVARDVTDTVQSERAETLAREQQSLITKLLQDKSGFAQFVADSERLIAALGTERNDAEMKRDLHTLKGNLGIFGLGTIAQFCHGIEDRLAVEGGQPSANEVADLAALWRARMQSIETFLGELGQSRLEVDAFDHARLIDSLLRRDDYEELLSMVELWSWQRTAERLARYRAHAEHLARRLDKHVHVSVVHNELRVPRDYLEKFWPTLIHVVRNAVDHGAEATEVRRAAGKPEAVGIVFETRETLDSLVIEVRDDGPGIDRESLLKAARAKDPRFPIDRSLRDLVFMDGLSSRTDVTEMSGRGVGLGAVRQACEAEGGQVEVLTERGQGTTFRFTFRRPIVKPGALAVRLERRWSLRPANNDSGRVSLRSSSR
jgi:signal transduction histidine kinase